MNIARFHSICPGKQKRAMLSQFRINNFTHLLTSVRSFNTTTCSQMSMIKQVKMLKKIMAGREKGKRRFVYEENRIPKAESIEKLSSARGQGKESNRRITVLNKLFMKNVTDLMASGYFGESLFGYGLQISTVKVTQDFKKLNVYWIADGAENDEKIAKILKSIAGPLRHELSVLRLMGEIPQITFVRDKAYSKSAEIDMLLKRADFGEDFKPTDPTLFMRAQSQIQLSLSDDIKQQIKELDNSIEENDEDFEEEMPEMRHDALGLDHAKMMNKIVSSMNKSKKAWESFENEVLANPSLLEEPREFLHETAEFDVEKLTAQAEMREDFLRYLEKRHLSKRNTPERKKHKNFINNEVDEVVEEYRDPIPDNDFIIEDEHKL